MPIRATPLVNGEYYHVYNRGVAKQNIFLSDRNYQRFEKTLEFYKPTKTLLSFSKYLQASPDLQTTVIQTSKTAPKQVEIVAYCLMPNHFHLLLKQLEEDGISEYMRKVGNSYTRYFNTKNDRVGSLFQGPFKSAHIDSNAYLLQLSRYIHLNPLQAGLTFKKDLSTYLYSSYPQYLTATPTNGPGIDAGIVLSQFEDAVSYQSFCLDSLDYSDTIAQIETLLLDPET